MADTWTTRASLPDVRNFFGVAAIGTKLYVAGGRDSPGAVGLDTLYEYDSTADTWATKASMPAGRWGCGMVAIGTKLYVAGGNDSLGVTQATLYEYDSTADTWATKASMPAVRRFAVVGAIGTKLYVAGGQNNAGARQTTLYEYDSTADTWATKTALPFGRHFAQGGAIGTKLYVAGGSGEITVGGPSAIRATLYEYDSTADTWATKASMPAVRTDAQAATLGLNLYVAGGASNVSVVDTLYEYDSTADTWATKASMPAVRTRMGNGDASVAGTIHALGGLILAAGASYDTHYEWPSFGSWSVGQIKIT